MVMLVILCSLCFSELSSGSLSGVVWLRNVFV